MLRAWLADSVDSLDPLERLVVEGQRLRGEIHCIRLIPCARGSGNFGKKPITFLPLQILRDCISRNLRLCTLCPLRLSGETEFDIVRKSYTYSWHDEM